MNDLGDLRFANIRDPEVFTRERIEQAEQAIAEELGQPPHLVAIYLDTLANPTHRNPGRPPGPKDIMIQRDGHQPVLLQRESEIFRPEMGLEHTWIYLYTPPLEDKAADQRAEELLWSQLNAV